MCCTQKRLSKYPYKKSIPVIVQCNTFTDNALVVVLAGGDKSKQKTDIKRARKLAEELEV